MTSKPFDCGAGRGKRLESARRISTRRDPPPPVVEIFDLPMLHALFQLSRALEPDEGQLLTMALSGAAGFKPNRAFALRPRRP
jgi:hypothetical protein